MACEPLTGKRFVKITERKTKIDWAYFLEDISALYTDAGKIILVMDNYTTHTPGALYEAYTHLLLAAWDKGLGTCCLTGPPKIRVDMIVFLWVSLKIVRSWLYCP
jgi:hypothetical protein